jgi:hypothetical protein
LQRMMPASFAYLPVAVRARAVRATEIVVSKSAADCLGPLDENMTLAEVLDRMKRGDARR